MSPLDQVDYFRPCQLETSYGIGTHNVLGEDSIHHFSRAKAERYSRAFQQIHQNDAKDNAGKNKEKTEVTISEDLADGQAVKLDAFLKDLADSESTLHVPSDEFDDDEIHLIETTSDKQDLGGLSGHALQDYQMQLMLLEQQNKKRLLKARQKQDQYYSQRRAAKIKARKAAASPLSRQNKDYMTKQSKDNEVPALERSALDCKQAQAKGKMPPKRKNVRIVSDTKKRKKVSAGHDPISHYENNNVANSDGSIAEHSVVAKRSPGKFEIIYMITCKQVDPDSHAVPAFRDVPIPDELLDLEDQGTLVGHSHLNGTSPIFDLESFMEDDTDDVAFIIVRTVECSAASILMARSGMSLRWTEQIYIKSNVLRNAMQQVATCYFQPISNSNPGGDPYDHTTTSSSLFEQNRITPVDLVLFHHRTSLQNHIREHPETEQHIGSLLEYTRKRYGPDFAEADDLFSRGLVTQEHILKLYRPNELVISGTYGRPAAFVVQEWPSLEDGWVTITCWSFQTDGSGFARKRSILSIPPIGPNTADIRRLPAYPLQFASPEVWESVRAYGKKQWDLRTTSQVTYRGENVKGDQYYPDARFMIDHRIYRKMHEYAAAFQFEKPTETYPFDRLPAYLSNEQKPSDESLLLLPPDIHGFYLNEKKWVHLYVDCIHPVSWNKKAYERLVLPSQTKDLVEALVTVRTSQRGVKQGIGVSGKRTDITTGKGNGLIMLLHGGPGTGKTLTAESVAEIAEMPLYRVTCGDIGTSAEAVEKYLNTVLHLGKIWNCVLLLDEADVFLEERSMSDLKRNSLVSVFLRILEYYDGILILTSNRVGMFDEAFKSRIQVALHYENLNRSSRKKIWQNFIEMLEDDEEDVNFDEIKLHLDDLAGKELNGRQIRNVLTTARQLAIFRKERLDWEHLLQALSVSSDFSAYLKRMQGHTDDQRARDSGLR